MCLYLLSDFRRSNWFFK